MCDFKRTGLESPKSSMSDMLVLYTNTLMFFYEKKFSPNSVLSYVHTRISMNGVTLYGCTQPSCRDPTVPGNVQEEHRVGAYHSGKRNSGTARVTSLVHIVQF